MPNRQTFIIACQHLFFEDMSNVWRTMFHCIGSNCSGIWQSNIVCRSFAICFKNIMFDIWLVKQNVFVWVRNKTFLVKYFMLVSDKQCFWTFSKTFLNRLFFFLLSNSVFDRVQLHIWNDIAVFIVHSNRPLSHQMTTTHKESVNCVKYNQSFKQVVTASDSSVSRSYSKC